MKCPKDSTQLMIDHKQGVVGYCCDHCHCVLLTEKGTLAFKANYETTIIENIFDEQNRSVSELFCSCCNEHMFITYVDDIELEICQKCKSVWFDEGEAQYIVDRYGPQSQQESYFIEFIEYFIWVPILIGMITGVINFLFH